jgi:hypothetical protein
MKLLGVVWENVYGLFVEDGMIAAGTLLALVVVGLWATLTGANHMLRDLGGPLLFVLLMALLVVNLDLAGRKAARERVA